MTLIIVGILLISFILIATEAITNVNKAAVAIFAGTLGWVLYICYGTDFVMSQHHGDYANFLDGAVATSVAVKQYIAQNIFLKYVGEAAEIVLFLLATMTIVEILDNNRCFDFVSQLLKTRSSRRMLWTMGVVTFLISANLDNITTTVMMLTIMHKVLPSRRLRMLYGSVIVLSANTGGALTVIGNPEGLVLWNMGKVTATDFSLSLFVPCLLAWGIPTWLIGRTLPERVETEWVVMPYRGDDTNLTVWQRLIMLFVGIGGLWFIPTFHNITKLSPFLGALCVLSILWVVNEVFNRRLFSANMMAERRLPHILRYGVIQMMLYVLGIMLAVGVVKETGAFVWLWERLDVVTGSTSLCGFFVMAVSSVLDNFATAMSFVVMKPEGVTNDIYYKVVAYAVMAGGNILATASMSGMVLLKMERMHGGWFFRHVGWKALLGGLIGLLVLMIQM
uniref:Sodium:proton antiporter NhaD n=3 Tax=unclassified Prevotella TaxID=2638335 RepID=A0AB33JKF9_9BACT